jgi:2-dehydropantoate 2-reductase
MARQNELAQRQREVAMRVAVIGPGAVGGYFGARLAQAGEEVTFVARGDTLRALREAGLRVESPDGDILLHPALATDDPATVGAVDLVLLAVKGWQAPEAIEVMRPLMGPDTLAVPLLNGVEAPDQLAAVYGQERVAGGLCGLFGWVVAPGHVRNGMAQPFITFGMLDNTPSERLERLQQAYERVGVKATVAGDIRAALWEKLLFVGPFGGVGAITRAPAGVFRSLPESRALLEGAMAEIVAVARAQGSALAEDAPAKALAMIDGSPPEATASMQRDIIAGRPSELASQIGVVTRMAQEANVAAPIHSMLYAGLLPQERRARGELAFQL